MKNRTIIIVCFFLTLLFSLPSFVAVPSVLPFLSSDVRVAAPQAISMFRKQGMWVVNAAFHHIERRGSEICFVWSHAYRSRFIQESPQPLTTCIDEEK